MGRGAGKAGGSTEGQREHGVANTIGVQVLENRGVAKGERERGRGGTGDGGRAEEKGRAVRHMCVCVHGRAAAAGAEGWPSGGA